MVSVSDALSFVIGLVFIYLVFSIVTSYVMEQIASIFGLRSNNLANAIQRLLDPAEKTKSGVTQVNKVWSAGLDIWDKGVAARATITVDEAVKKQLNENVVKAFYSHPIIRTLSTPKGLPSYIRPADFSNALFDLFIKASCPGEVTDPKKYLKSVKDGIALIDNPSLKGSLLPLIENAEVMEKDTEKRIALARSNIEAWFNTTMERSAGWYKRKTVWIAFLVGCVIAILFNVDTLAISQSLLRDTSLRQSISNEAVAFIQQGKDQNADAALQEIKTLNLPLGWNGMRAQGHAAPEEFPVLPGEIFLKVMGLLITGMAISQGSSIWFQTLQKLINLRSSGANPADEKQAPPALKST